MNKIIMIRHGETEWNQVGKQQGHLDSPLSECGRLQAKALAVFFRDKKIDYLYSSDLDRAFQTAEIIAKEIQLSVIKEKGLRERNLGILQGLTKNEFKDRFPLEYKKFRSGDADYVLPNGESRRQRFNRNWRCLQDIVERHQNDKLLIVAHGGVLDTVFRAVLQIPIDDERRFSLINGSINSFSFENGKWRLESWGETNHLGDIPALDDF